MKSTYVALRPPGALRASVCVAALALIPTAHSVTGVADAAQSNPCGELANPYGPFDYRTFRGQQLKIVEENHYNDNVDRLISGITAPIGGDIDYTLRAFPNHHRALNATMRLGERHKTAKVPYMRYSVDCWFDRAIRFAPDDTVVRLLFATHLGKTGRTEAALAQAKYASDVAVESAITQYNVGLLMLELGRPDLALLHAHRAMALGYPREDLKRRLVTLGKWREPVVSAVDAASAPPAADAVATPSLSATVPAGSKN